MILWVNYIPICQTVLKIQTRGKHEYRFDDLSKFIFSSFLLIGMFKATLLRA